MTRSDDILRLPSDLPVPVDDGMASHLLGLSVVPRSLPSTTGQLIDLSALAGRTVVYCYPRTGRPDQEPPDGWNLIPGARGCTPQSCAFRDHHRELEALGARVFGLSTQDTEYQREAVARLHLPFALLSDARFEFTSAMRLLRGALDAAAEAAYAYHSGWSGRARFLSGISAGCERARSGDLARRSPGELIWQSMEKVNLDEKLSLISEHWRPKVVGELNGQEVKLVKFVGTFVWHHHEREDELFLGVHGRFRVEFRDRSIEVGPGEFVIVPHGVEHRTVADEEAHVLVFEPAATRNTGNVEDMTLTAPTGVRI